MTELNSSSCIHCGRDESQVPLVILRYKESQYLICTEHFPILIHNPARLAGVLPDADSLTPADHD
jgi:hypothetical protein